MKPELPRGRCPRGCRLAPAARVSNPARAVAAPVRPGDGEPAARRGALSFLCWRRRGGRSRRRFRPADSGGGAGRRFEIGGANPPAPRPAPRAPRPAPRAIAGGESSPAREARAAQPPVRNLKRASPSAGPPTSPVPRVQSARGTGARRGVSRRLSPGAGDRDRGPGAGGGGGAAASILDASGEARGAAPSLSAPAVLGVRPVRARAGGPRKHRAAFASAGALTACVPLDGPPGGCLSVAGLHQSIA